MISTIIIINYGNTRNSIFVLLFGLNIANQESRLSLILSGDISSKFSATKSTFRTLMTTTWFTMLSTALHVTQSQASARLASLLFDLYRLYNLIAPPFLRGEPPLSCNVEVRLCQNFDSAFVCTRVYFKLKALISCSANFPLTMPGSWSTQRNP